MKRIVLAIVVVVFAIGASFAGDQIPIATKIIIPDTDLIPISGVKDGDELMGLYCSTVGYMLAPTLISVEKALDEFSRPVMRVKAKSESRPLFLITGVSNFKPGIVPTFFSGEKFLFPGESLVLTSPEDACSPGYSVLQAFGKAVNRRNRDLIYDYKVKLNSGDKVQVLDYYKTSKSPKTYKPGQTAVLDITDHLITTDLSREMELPILIWAGDIDRDNNPDLFMWWPCPGKNAGVYSLFLSSKAGKSDLVAKTPVGVRLPILAEVIVFEK